MGRADRSGEIGDDPGIGLGQGMRLAGVGLGLAAGGAQLLYALIRPVPRPAT